MENYIGELTLLSQDILALTIFFMSFTIFIYVLLRLSNGKDKRNAETRKDWQKESDGYYNYAVRTTNLAKLENKLKYINTDVFKRNNETEFCFNMGRAVGLMEYKIAKIMEKRDKKMEKWLMVADETSTGLISEVDFLDPNKKHWFHGTTSIITEFNTETWEEAKDLYDDYINKNGK